MLYPLKFKPVYKDYLWGGRNLEKLGKKLPEGKVAESWEISADADSPSIVSNGYLKGKKLRTLADKYPKEIMGANFIMFPLLFKLLDANDKLSIQVHPDDWHAQAFENRQFGKHEAWYVLNAKQDAKIVYGLKPGLDKESFRKSVLENNVEKSLNYVKVKAGDVINVAPGTAHSIGEGITLAEIQQSSDITYRVYDYGRLDDKGRQRQLHIEKALHVMDFKVDAKRAMAKGLEYEINPKVRKTMKLATEHFAIELLNVDGEVTFFEKRHGFHIFFIMAGEAYTYFDMGITDIKKGETVLFPADLGKHVVFGDFSALDIYVPSIKQDVILPLAKAGYSTEEINENVLR